MTNHNMPHQRSVLQDVPGARRVVGCDGAKRETECSTAGCIEQIRRLGQRRTLLRRLRPHRHLSHYIIIAAYNATHLRQTAAGGGQHLLEDGTGGLALQCPDSTVHSAAECRLGGARQRHRLGLRS